MRNVEIKARVADLAAIEPRARAIATEGPTDIAQDDTFFGSAHGRLKLRRLGDGSGQLIHYTRADEAGPKTSEYRITTVQDAASLGDTLGDALGITGRVVKQRRLYLAGRTRIHLDRVEGLGTFVELEVVLREDESEQAGRVEADRIMQSLGIAESQLVRGAYVDLA